MFEVVINVNEVSAAAPDVQQDRFETAMTQSNALGGCTFGLGSSGNLLADKRYAYGEAMAAEGDDIAAADLFAQAQEQAPHWAPAYLAQGLALERAGQMVAARNALAAAVERDPTGQLGAGLHLARLSDGMPASMPATYVQTLFDQYAPRFDAHLVEALAYRGPEVVLDALQRAAPKADARLVLDLGCGTGLMARALARPGRVVDGIDLSPAMLREAAATTLYRSLWQGDCVARMETIEAGSYDLAVAADVLVYLGDLGSVLSAVARVVRRGGLFVATCQAKHGQGFEFGPDLRFRHAESYLRTALTDVTLEPLAVDACVTRHENGVPVEGLVFVARCP